MKRFLSLILFFAVALLLSTNSFVDALELKSLQESSDKKTVALSNKLAIMSESETAEVAIWIQDIDYDAVKEAIQVENTRGVSPQTHSSKSLSRLYRNIWIDQLTKAHQANNNNFSAEQLVKMQGVEVVYKSNISPMIVVKANKKDILSLTNCYGVELIDVCGSAKGSALSTIANENSGVNYLSNTSSLSATGEGVKIGMLENTVPDLTTYSELFNASKVFIDAEDLAKGVSSHATLVAAIMVGKPTIYPEDNGTMYKGIATDAELYCTAFTQSANGSVNFSDVMSCIDKLISQKQVDVINMSYALHYTSNGFPYSYYDNFTRWVDYVINTTKTHFVVAAGNNGSISGNEFVESPAIAYNVVSVGSYDDSNTLILSHAPSDLLGQELNDDFVVSNTSSFLGYISAPTQGNNQGRILIYKPDIVASGNNIRYASFYKSGTSFAAPQVAGMIAQLCDIYPALLTKPMLVKAMLMSGASYLANITASGDVKDSGSQLYLKQGAGIANVRCSYSNYYGGRIKEVTKSFATGEKYSFTINVPSSFSYIKMAMCWGKTCNETSDYVATEVPHANLRLDVYYGTNTTGTPVASSNTMYTNTELLQFAVTQSGTYTVVVTRVDSGTKLIHNVAISWY